LNPLFPVYREGFALVEKRDGGSSEFMKIDGGSYNIGFSGDGFCFDNELARHEVHLDPFEIRNSVVTNREFNEFIDAGGYRDPLIWHSEGWDWVNQNRIEAPLYWHNRDGEWFNYTLAGLRKVDPDAPVCHVSYYEAFGVRRMERDAFADRIRMGSRERQSSIGDFDGNGRTRRTSHTRDLRSPVARSANTTVSS
jgi:hypothetical protein